MAWIDKWVSSQATGGGDGSQASPWTITEGFANLGNNIRLNIQNDGTYSCSAQLDTVATSGSSYPAAIVGRDSFGNIATSWDDLPTLDFSAATTGSGINNTNSNYIIHGIRVVNTPSNGIINSASGTITCLCVVENSAGPGIYLGGIGFFNKVVDAGGTVGVSMNGANVANCLVEWTAPTAKKAFDVGSGCLTNSIAINAGQLGAASWGGLVVNCTLIGDQALNWTAMTLGTYSCAVGNHISDAATGIAFYHDATAAWYNNFNGVTTPTDIGTYAPYILFSMFENPDFFDAAQGDYRPRNKNLEAVIPPVKQNPGAFPYLPKGGWRPRPRWHGV